jgi:hypothetical protein
MCTTDTLTTSCRDGIASVKVVEAKEKKKKNFRRSEREEPKVWRG